MKHHLKKIASLLLLTALLLVTAFSALAETDMAPDADFMMTVIEELSAYPRGVANEEILQARQYLIDKIEGFGLEVTTQTFIYETRDWGAFRDYVSELPDAAYTDEIDWESLMPGIIEFEAVNIIASIMPNTEVKTDDILIIGAHYDAVDNVPGANDNASGVAVVLELIRLLADAPTDTEIRFVFFDVEEVGLIGSMHYAASLSDEELDNVVGMLNFDMLAGAREETVKVYSADGKENFLLDLLRQNEYFESVELDVMLMGSSDHVSFFTMLIPALCFSHDIIFGEFHNENDIIGHISQDMLVQAANKGLAIVSVIISEDTPSFKSFARPERDDTIYTLHDNARFPSFAPLSMFETETGISLSQVRARHSGSFMAHYQAMVRLFGMPEVLTLEATAYVMGEPRISGISVNMQEAGVSFDRLYGILTEAFGEPAAEGDDFFMHYTWNSIYGNSYLIQYMTVQDHYQFYIQEYRDEAREGYTLSGGELVRMEESDGGVEIHFEYIDGEVVWVESESMPSETLQVTEHARRAWQRLVEHMTEEELNNTVFITIGTDGLYGDFVIDFITYGSGMTRETIVAYIDFESERMAEYIQGGETIVYHYYPEGLYIFIDYLDLTHPSGKAYSDEALQESIEEARNRRNAAETPSMPSAWAIEGILNALESGILSEEIMLDVLAVSGFQESISRENFCVLVYNLLAGLVADTGFANDTDSPFTDTERPEIIALYNLGIVTGKTETEFAPYLDINRQEAAAIMYRASMLLETGIVASDFVFVDDAGISDFAKEAVYMMFSAGIMTGVGDDIFAPGDAITVEQAILTVVRLWLACV